MLDLEGTKRYENLEKPPCENYLTDLKTRLLVKCVREQDFRYRNRVLVYASG